MTARWLRTRTLLARAAIAAAVFFVPSTVSASFRHANTGGPGITRRPATFEAASSSRIRSGQDRHTGGRIPKRQATEKPTRTIAVTVNGQALAGDLPAQVAAGRVLVPLRETFAALGLDIASSGTMIRATAPTGTVTLASGSDRAYVDRRPIRLDARVQAVHGTLYVPLSLLSAAFGAQTAYDQRGASVDIVSLYFGRMSGAEQRRADGGSDVQGNVSAIDTNSEPPSITVVRAGTERTIAVTSDAKIWTEDVTVHSQLPAKLGDVHVGDALHAVLARDGRLISVFDYFQSTSGTIAAVSPTAFVLGDGRVVTPSSATSITLDASPAQFDELKPGDYVTVRSNPESGELREIIATRTGALAGSGASPASGTPPRAAKIAAVALSAMRPLRAGQTLDVVMEGTPHGRASFDIGDYLSGLPMHEHAPGVYTGRFTVPERFNVTDVPVYGELKIGDAGAARAAASQTFSAATTPPAFGSVAPAPNETVNSGYPSIYATYTAPTSIGIAAGSVVLTVDGRDVTPSATRGDGFVVYIPSQPLHNGPVKVLVKVSDAAGNTAQKAWNFTVRTP